MSRVRIDDEGHLVTRIVDWKPTLTVISRGLGFGVMAIVAAWISPVFLFTFLLMEMQSVDAAWIFAVALGLLTTSYYLVFMAGRRKLVAYRDGGRSKEPLLSNPGHDYRDYWVEYHVSFNKVREDLRRHQELVQEMKDAGLDPEKARPSFLSNPL